MVLPKKERVKSESEHFNFRRIYLVDKADAQRYVIEYSMSLQLAGNKMEAVVCRSEMLRQGSFEL